MTIDRSFLGFCFFTKFVFLGVLGVLGGSIDFGVELGTQPAVITSGFEHSGRFQLD
jgi:hypothetical protein